MKLRLVGRAVYLLATSGAASVFVVCSGDLQFEVAVDEEWLIGKPLMMVAS